MQLNLSVGDTVEMTEYSGIADMLMRMTLFIIVTMRLCVCVCVNFIEGRLRPNCGQCEHSDWNARPARHAICVDEPESINQHNIGCVLI